MTAAMLRDFIKGTLYFIANYKVTSKLERSDPVIIPYTLHAISHVLLVLNFIFCRYKSCGDFVTQPSVLFATLNVEFTHI